MNEDAPLRERIDFLESFVAFQERSMSQLDEALKECVARIEELQSDAEALDTQAPEVGGQCDPPPHY